jgi:ribosomal protein L40E
MIVCRDCGHRNEQSDEFCGSCGSFLEFSGERIAEPTKPVVEHEADDADSISERMKRALEVDDNSVQGHLAIHDRMSTDDTALARSVAAAAEQQQAEANEAERRQAEQQQLSERESLRLDAERKAAVAQQQLEELRMLQRQEAEEAAARLAKAQQEATQQAEARLAQAEAEAIRKADAERADLEARIAQERLQAERVAAEAQEHLARAKAAEAAADADRDEIAHARAEAEAARAEAASLRAAAALQAAELAAERELIAAERLAAEQLSAAREANAVATAQEQARLTSQLEAEAHRAEYERAAAQRKAEAELEANQAEARAAAAELAAAKAKAEAAEQMAKRDREEALRKAAAMVAVAPAVASPLVNPTAPTTPKPQAKRGPQGSAETSATASTSAPAARLPGAAQERVAPKSGRSSDLNPGDLVCGGCGAGNVPSRKFCRRCGATLAEAAKAKVGLFARMRSWRRRRKQRALGSRPGRTASGGTSLAERGRIKMFRLNVGLLRFSALLGALAVFGFGVEPVRSKLRLPNARVVIIDAIRRNSKPVYDPVRPATAVASTAAKGSSGSALIDLNTTTSWLAAPSPANGVGATLTMQFPKPFDLGRVLLTSGVAPDPETGTTYALQPRPSEFRVIFDDDVANPLTVAVQDIGDPQVLKISRKQVTKVQFTITAVYPGIDGKGTSVAITELEFFQRRAFGDDFETLALPALSSASQTPVTPLIDDDLNTAWTSAAGSSGVGSGFSMTFAVPTDLDRIRIAPGGPEATFQATARPKEVQLAFFCDGRCPATKQVTFEDKPGWKDIGVTLTGVTRIDVVVRSVFGTGEVSFAELQVQRRRPRVN